MTPREVVLVDDDKLVLELAERSMRGVDWRLTCFSDEEKALSYLRVHTPHVLILDLRMPRLSGTELLRELMEGSAEVAQQVYICSSVRPPAVVCNAIDTLGAQLLLKDTLRAKKPFMDWLAEAGP